MAKTTWETFTTTVRTVIEKNKELIAEGNVRKIIIKDKNGKELMTFPLTIGVVGAMLARCLPQLEPWQL
jgi:hypothetical protein